MATRIRLILAVALTLMGHGAASRSVVSRALWPYMMGGATISVRRW